MNQQDKYGNERTVCSKKKIKGFHVSLMKFNELKDEKNQRKCG